jgi:hypothetical protein
MKGIKLNKDQIQKIILSTIGFVALIYCYFTFFLGPLNKSRNAATQTIADLQGKIASSKTEVRKTANLEIQAKTATARYAGYKATTAGGAPIAWFPPRIRNFFASKGIDKANVRLEGSTEFKEPELSDWIKDTWTIELPSSDFSPLGEAIADLENTEPLLALQKIVIHAVPDNPQFQQVSLSAQDVMLNQ